MAITLKADFTKLTYSGFTIDQRPHSLKITPGGPWFLRVSPQITLSSHSHLHLVLQLSKSFVYSPSDTFSVRWAISTCKHRQVQVKLCVKMESNIFLTAPNSLISENSLTIVMSAYYSLGQMEDFTKYAEAWYIFFLVSVDVEWCPSLNIMK